MDELVESSTSSLDPSTWVDQYGDSLYRYAMSRLRDAEAADEVVQETFVSGLRHVEQYSCKGSEGGWLMGILKRKIIDLVRYSSQSKLFGNRKRSLRSLECGEPKLGRVHVMVRAVT